MKVKQVNCLCDPLKMKKPEHLLKSDCCQCCSYQRPIGFCFFFQEGIKFSVFSPRCLSQYSPTWMRESGARRDALDYLLVMRNRTMNMKIQLQICLQVFLMLWCQQVMQDVATGLDPTSKTSDSAVSDANLMFEILLGGVELNQDNNIMLLDEEMASMRAGRTFLFKINDNIPRNLRSMKQMMTTLEGQSGPLTQTQFEGLLLSMVFSAHQASHQEIREKKEVWGGVLLQLVNITVHELRGNYLVSYAE